MEQSRAYARDTSKKIHAVQRAKGERGERVGTAIPYGYMKDPADTKQIVPEPKTAPIIKRIFETYADGIGIVKICDMLKREKVLAPSVYAFQRDGNRSGNPDMSKPYHWAQTTVRKILSNQTYCGDTVNFKTFTKFNKLKKRIKNAPENVLIFPDTHEAIIDRKTFEFVQKHFEGRKRPDKQGEIDKYAGILYCGECGSRLYLHRAKTLKPELNNFMCGGYQSRKTDCTSHYIMPKLTAELLQMFIRRIEVFEKPEKYSRTCGNTIVIHYTFECDRAFTAAELGKSA